MSESTGTPTPVTEPSPEPIEDAALPPSGDGEPSPKQVPVSEAIRYRKRAQAAEKELGELKQAYDKQAEAMAALKEQMEQPQVDQSHPLSTVKTQGVKESRTSGARGRLQTAARRAADTGRRADVQEYLRLRRNFV